MNTRSGDLTKQILYESVKTLLGIEEAHILLPQKKLFTLFSVAFQYFLFCSTKKHGAYILRIEDGLLCGKLARKAKDSSTRNFLQSLLLPRKFNYGKSTFVLDFFTTGSWNLVAEIPRHKIQGALIVKNTTARPMRELAQEEGQKEGQKEGEEQQASVPPAPEVPSDYYLTSLMEFVPKSITIDCDCPVKGLVPVKFPFIKEEQESVQGLTLSREIDLDALEDENDPLG